MDSIPPVVFQLLYGFCGLVMLAGVLVGLITGILFFIRSKNKNLSDRLFFLLLFALSLTLLSNFLSFFGIYEQNPFLYFIPLYFTFSIGILLFFYVKSKLYSNFRIEQSDSKHFIFPGLQIITFTILFFTTTDFRLVVMDCCSPPLYGFVEDAIYIWLMSMYLYFSYSFIRHERIQVKRTGASKRYVLLLGWQKRLVKVLTILFSIHAACLVTYFFCYRFLGIDLESKALFLSRMNYPLRQWYSGWC